MRSDVYGKKGVWDVENVRFLYPFPCASTPPFKRLLLSINTNRWPGRLKSGPSSVPSVNRNRKHTGRKWKEADDVGAVSGVRGKNQLSPGC